MQGIERLLPPPPGPGVCNRCRGPARVNDDECWCCSKVGRLLGADDGGNCALEPLLVARCGADVHRAIRLYKDGATAECRRHFRDLLADLMDELIADRQTNHSTSVTNVLLSADAVAVVPSTTRRGDRRERRLPAPFEQVVKRTRTLSGFELIGFGGGPGRARHLAPDADAFEVHGDLPGRRVVVVDDAWVTGSRARSTVAALRRSGAQVSAVIALARLVDVEACPLNRRWWLAVSGPKAA